MKSIKPGRGASAMGAISSVIAIIFGIFWTIEVVTMGSPTYFIIFGIMFIGVGIVQLIYNYKNATGNNRMSIYDITDETEESDRFDRNLVSKKQTKSIFKSNDSIDNNYKHCPYCGRKMNKDFKFCPSCGKEINR